MGYATIPMSFWEYVLETTAYLLNLIPSKFVPKTLAKLWLDRKPSMRNIHVWGCPTYVLKGKADKLESKTEVCLFVGYPKGTRDQLFYSLEKKKVFVPTNERFF